MERYKKCTASKLILAIAFSIMLPAGIIGIILGATNGITSVMVIGIVFTVLGFYGAPICWISYGEHRGRGVVLRMIEQEHIYSVKDIATQVFKNEKEVTAIINKLILDGSLNGYIFRNGYIEVNTNKKQTGIITDKIKCPNCNGPMEFDGINYVCSYCGNAIKKE